MKINWEVRLRHPAFYTALAGFIGFILVDSGVVVDAGRMETYFELFFGVLVVAGVITDMTTEGLKDSQQAMTYRKPRGD